MQLGSARGPAWCPSRSLTHSPLRYVDRSRRGELGGAADRKSFCCVPLVTTPRCAACARAVGPRSLFPTTLETLHDTGTVCTSRTQRPWMPRLPGTGGRRQQQTVGARGDAARSAVRACSSAPAVLLMRVEQQEASWRHPFTHPPALPLCMCNNRPAALARADGASWRYRQRQRQQRRQRQRQRP